MPRCDDGQTHQWGNLTEYTAGWARQCSTCGAMRWEGEEGQMEPMTLGARLIAEERSRQQTQEGWTPEWDSDHVDGELVQAAIAYLTPQARSLHSDRNVPPTWPWEDEAWKPSGGPTRNLVKAGALIAAEIDRLKLSQAAQALLRADAIREPRR